MSKFQVFSDTHFETNHLNVQMPRRAENLILAGDISTWSHSSLYEFLDYASVTWKHVFYVPGNHEFYCTTVKASYHTIDTELRQKINSRYTNVFYLNNDTVYVNDTVHMKPVDGSICIIGSILWSAPMEIVEPTINDFSLICIDEGSAVKPMRAVDMRKLNKECVQYIKSQMTDMPTILITHFPPIRGGTSPPKYAFSDESIKQYFSNQLDYIIYDNAQIKWWVFGHTHHANAIEKGNCKLLTNAIGYRNETISRRHFLYDNNDPYSCVFEM